MLSDSIGRLERLRYGLHELDPSTNWHEPLQQATPPGVHGAKSPMQGTH